MSKDKPKIQIEDLAFEKFAEEYSATMDLVELCDWDDDKAMRIFEKALNALVDLYEFSQYDADFITNGPQLEQLMRINMNEEVTDEQFKAILAILSIKAKRELNKKERPPNLN